MVSSLIGRGQHQPITFHWWVVIVVFCSSGSSRVMKQLSDVVDCTLREQEATMQTYQFMCFNIENLVQKSDQLMYFNLAPTHIPTTSVCVFCQQ